MKVNSMKRKKISRSFAREMIALGIPHGKGRERFRFFPGVGKVRGILGYPEMPRVSIARPIDF